MAAFGQTPRGIHVGLLLLNAATIVLVYLLGRRLFDRVTGSAAAAAYAALSLSQPIFGVFAHATHFVVLPALGGLLLLLRGLDSGRRATLLLGGALLGLATLMKQHGTLFLLFGVVYLLWEGRRRGRDVRRLAGDGALVALGGALPLLATVAILWRAGVLEAFWFWTFRYAGEYVSRVGPGDGLRYLYLALSRIVQPALPLWALAFAGLVVLLADRGRRYGREFGLGFLLFSFLAVCPGFYFRGHYFVLLLPAAALLAGIAAGAARRALLAASGPAIAAIAPALLVSAAIGYQAWRERAYLFGLPPREVSRRIYSVNPFPEAIEVARRIAAATGPEERVAVVGSEPEIYFYARRRSATGHIYMYGLMEEHRYAARMQEEVRREIEAARPAFIVLVNIPQSWLIGPRSDRRFLDWAVQYVRDHYEVDGLVEIESLGSTRYRWGAEAAGASPDSPYQLWVFRRRPAA